jgi:hypothetical protein
MNIHSPKFSLTKVTITLIIFGLVVISFLGGKYYGYKAQAKIIGETNNKLLSLLTNSSDFATNNILWEKVHYDFSIKTLNGQNIVYVTRIMAGKQTTSETDFVFIHEIILYKDGKVPSDNPSDYYNPPLKNQNVELPGLDKNAQTYCWSNEGDYLSECAITIRNSKVISTFDLRIFNPDDQLAFEIMPSVAMKFIDRLAKSDFGK